MSKGRLISSFPHIHCLLSPTVFKYRTNRFARIRLLPKRDFATYYYSNFAAINQANRIFIYNFFYRVSAAARIVFHARARHGVLVHHPVTVSGRPAGSRGTQTAYPSSSSGGSGVYAAGTAYPTKSGRAPISPTA